MHSLAQHDGAGLTDAERIDALRELEELKAAVAATQARITAAFETSQREQARPSLRQDPTRLARSITTQVALARRDAPSKGQRHVGVATALVREMPHTMAALTSGVISEWRATLIVRETACLSRADRAKVDAEIAPLLAGAGDKRVADTARGVAQRLDPGAATRRNAKAEADRRVTVRPAPDTMTNLTGLLPVAKAVAAYAAVRKQAESLRAQGDPRTISQLMADVFQARLTGTDLAVGAAAPSPGVEVALVMSPETLLGDSAAPAHLPDYGPIPAAVARRLVREADRAWIRRLYTAPVTGDLVQMDARRRTFDGNLRTLVVWRDQTCRNSWCDAPIRHLDHVQRHSAGGGTTLDNAQGLCEACNYVKEAPGWRADVTDGLGHVVVLSTPTGHTYGSSPPRPPGGPPPSRLEARLRQIIDDAA